MEIKEIEINVGEDLEVSNIREKENGVVLTVQKKFIPRLGELCYCELKSGFDFIFTYGISPKHLYSRACYNPKTNYFSTEESLITDDNNNITKLRSATKEESELFFSKIPEGYTLDENGYMVRYFWRAGKKESYYYISDYLSIERTLEANNLLDDIRYNTHNYFKTQEEAIIKRDKIKKLLYENQ